MYENNLVTSYCAENDRRRNERSIQSNFRIGSSTLEIEKGRFSKPVTPLNFRTCNLKCFRGMKNTSYYIVNISNTLRFDLFAQYKNIEVNFEDFNENDKLYFLMDNSYVQDILAKTLV